MNVNLQATCNGEIDLKGITYYYPTRPETLVLNNFNVTAKRGQSIAIVGPSGGGKSTVVQLIERFYDVFSGVVVRMSKRVSIVISVDKSHLEIENMPLNDTTQFRLHVIIS